MCNAMQPTFITRARMLAKRAAIAQTINMAMLPLKDEALNESAVRLLLRTLASCSAK
jgi:hypothetical protein